MSGQQRHLSDELCIKIIKRVAARHKIAPRLITTRLMDDDDKDSMRRGEISEDVLDLFVRLWIKKGMPMQRHVD